MNGWMNDNTYRTLPVLFLFYILLIIVDILIELS